MFWCFDTWNRLHPILKAGFKSDRVMRFALALTEPSRVLA